MTDEEKLDCLDKREAEGWRLLDLQVESLARIRCLEVIDLCQRVRAGLEHGRLIDVSPEHDGKIWATPEMLEDILPTSKVPPQERPL